jgi:hypothetical protein
MPAPRSLDAGTDRLPRSMRAAQGQSLDWKEQARCRQGMRPSSIPHFAWKVDRKDKGESLLGRDAEVWIQLALAECRNCPAQYACARFAIDVDEKWGTWAMDIDMLKWLKKNAADPKYIIDVAEEFGVPVQVAVKATHDGHAMR